MPRFACGCSVGIDRRGRIAWSPCGAAFCPDDDMLAVAETLRERGRLQEPEPPPARDCSRCGEPLPEGSHPTRRRCPPCQRAAKLERVREYTARKRATDPAWRERQRQRAQEYEATRNA